MICDAQARIPGLSALLIVTTAAPRVHVTLAVGALVVAVAALVAGGSLFAVRNTSSPSPAWADARTWTMPPIESLKPPQRSALQTAGLVVIRCYLFAAIAVLAVRTFQMTLGTG